MRVSAPGKLMLLGEYAVLEGGLALVAAVRRRALGELVEAEVPPSKVVRAVWAEARREQGRADGQSGNVAAGGDWRLQVSATPRRAKLRFASSGFAAESVLIDTSGFIDPGGEKLGLGSSAAVAVATAALALGAGDERVLEAAIRGHRAAAGGVGSAVDVAASYFGGVIATRRQPAPVEPLPSKIEGLHLSVFFTGTAANTPALVRACRASGRWEERVAEMKPIAVAGAKAWADQDARAFLRAVEDYAAQLEQLGLEAGVQVVTPKLKAIMRSAAQGGGAAKPSGAGGGDVAVMWAADPGLGAQVAERCGVRLLDLQVDPRGLSRRG